MIPQSDQNSDLNRPAADGPLSRAAAAARGDRRILSDLGLLVFPPVESLWQERYLAAIRTLAIGIAADMFERLAASKAAADAAHAAAAERLIRGRALADPDFLGFVTGEALLADIDRRLRAAGAMGPVPLAAAALADHADPIISDAAAEWLAAESRHGGISYSQLPARLLHWLAGVIAAHADPASASGLAALLSDHDESRSPAVSRRRLAHLLDAAGEATLLLEAPVADIGAPLHFALLGQLSGLDLTTMTSAAALARWSRLAVIYRAVGVAPDAAMAALVSLAGTATAGGLPDPADYRAMSREGARNLVANWRIEARIGRAAPGDAA